MIYREYRPAPSLAELVECYWSLEGSAPDGAPGGHRVLPDGCMDLVFHLGSGSPSAQAVGSMSRAMIVLHTGEIRTWGIRFRPGGARPLLGLPSNELTDRAPDLELLWGPDASELQERLAGAPSPSHRLHALHEALVRRVRPDHRDPLVERARALLQASDGNLEIAGLAAHAGLGTRQLQRRFHASVGLSPKELARILRFRAAADALAADPALEKGPLALELGYYDQAHFGRDFRALAGVSPTRYLEERRGVAFVQAEDDLPGQIGPEEAVNPCES